MASYYWIKLYHEILDDPKMGRLPDRLWRRTVEMFLLAGKQGGQGELPPISDMAWTLRISPDDLQADLDELEHLGIICQKENCPPLVVNFAKRQAPVTDAQRKRHERERKRHEQYAPDVTNPSRNVTGQDTNRTTELDIDSDQDSEVDSESDAPAPEGAREQNPPTPAMLHYESRFGLFEGCDLPPFLEAEQEFGVDRMKAAIDWAHSKGVNRMSAIITAARNWQFSTGPPGSNGGDRSSDATLEALRILEAENGDTS